MSCHLFAPGVIKSPVAVCGVIFILYYFAPPPLSAYHSSPDRLPPPLHSAQLILSRPVWVGGQLLFVCCCFCEVVCGLVAGRERFTPFHVKSVTRSVRAARSFTLYFPPTAHCNCFTAFTDSIRHHLPSHPFSHPFEAKPNHPVFV